MEALLVLFHYVEKISNLTLSPFVSKGYAIRKTYLDFSCFPV